jgi:isopropylmalate/homocitrate/citramalate synthase
VRLVDTTLRDGSHAMAHRFTEQNVRDTVRELDKAGVSLIEVTHGDGLGGSTFNYGFSLVDERTLIAAAVEEARNARIAVLLLPGLGTVTDLRAAADLGAGAVRIAALVAEFGDQAEVGYHGHQNLSFGVANSVLAQRAGARQIDGSLVALGAGAGNSPTEVLAATFERLGVGTGVDKDVLMAAAENVVKPYITRLPVPRRT